MRGKFKKLDKGMEKLIADIARYTVGGAGQILTWYIGYLLADSAGVQRPVLVGLALCAGVLWTSAIRETK